MKLEQNQQNKSALEIPKMESQCALNYDEIEAVAVGLMKVGHLAGRAKVLAREMPYAQDEKGKQRLAREICNLVPLDNIAYWRKSHPEATYMAHKIVENQIWGHPVENGEDFLCTFASLAVEDDSKWRALQDALTEIGDMIEEPCGMSHLTAIASCIIAKDSCADLKNWRDTRQGVIETHHKARIPPDLIKQVASHIDKESDGVGEQA